MNRLGRLGLAVLVTLALVAPALAQGTLTAIFEFQSMIVEQRVIRPQQRSLVCLSPREIDFLS